MHGAITHEQEQVAIEMIEKLLAGLDLKSILEANNIHLHEDEYNECVTKAALQFLVNIYNSEDGDNIIQTALEEVVLDAEIDRYIII